MKELLELFLCFAKIGSVTFGGGYAMLPILQEEFVDKRKWITLDELTDYYAIGQCTPGVIAVNVATFIGSKRKGVIGGIIATLGLISVPIVIITLIAAFLRSFAELEIIKDAFAGIRVCVFVLILNSVLRLWNKSMVDKTTIILGVVIFILTAFDKVLPVSFSPEVLVVAAAILGILLCKDRKETN